MDKLVSFDFDEQKSFNHCLWSVFLDQDSLEGFIDNALRNGFGPDIVMFIPKRNLSDYAISPLRNFEPAESSQFPYLGKYRRDFWEGYVDVYDPKNSLPPLSVGIAKYENGILTKVTSCRIAIRPDRKFL